MNLETIVTVFGAICLCAVFLMGVLWAVLWSADRLLKILGLAGWMLATYQQVRKDHGWVDQNCPWWWHWSAGHMKPKEPNHD